MGNSELIVFLPLVGAILGGMVGAVGGAWANSWYRDRETRKVEDRERRSLLLMIKAEVDFNVLYLEAASDGPPSAVIPHLRTAVWDKSQVRLAHLLPTNFVRKLVLYYELTRLLQLSETASVDDPDNLSDSDWDDIRGLQAKGFTIVRMAQEYIQDTEFIDTQEVVEGSREDAGQSAQ